MELNKTMLKDYDIVIFNNGKQGLFLNGWFYIKLSDNRYGVDDYEANLVNNDNVDYTIVEILRPNYESIAKREVIKLTMEEIKAIIGYDFEIVEEK